MFEGIKSKLRSKTVPLVAVEGTNEITRMAFVDGAEDSPNRIFNEFDLLGYEKKSDTLELFDDERYLGRGYVADICGVTVDLKRTPGPMPDSEPSKEPDISGVPVGSILIQAKSFIERVTPDWKKNKDKPVLVPCALMEGKDRIQAIRFKYLRLVGTDVLIDDKKKARYTIPATLQPIDISMPDGKSGRGYPIDMVTGTAIPLYRRVKVLAKVYPLDAEGKPMKDKLATLVEVGINFAGLIGGQATAEKLKAVASSLTGREQLKTALFWFFVGQAVLLFWHI